MGTAQRDPTPLADGIVCLHALWAAIYLGCANTGNAFASFLLGQVQTFAIDLQQTDIQERAHFQEYFIQDDWKVSNRLTINPGLRYTLNFPSTEINGQTAIFNLQTRQLEYPGTDPVRPLKKNNFGPRFGAVYRVTDKTIVSSGYGLVWIEMAGITTPFTTPNFPVPAGRVAPNARQHRTGVRAGERTDRHASRSDANRRPRTRRVHR